MKKQFTKVIAVFLAILMLPGASLFGYLDLDEIFTVEASASEYFTSGYCGEVTETNDGTNLSWVLDNDGTLTITGTGRMRPEAFNIDLRIKSVIIGEGVENIAEKAFYQCTNITSVTMSDSVITIDSHAFYNCKNITSVNFSENLNVIFDNAFTDCKKITELLLPDSLKTIEKSSFYGCSSLQSIDFSNLLEEIGDLAFYNCSKLTEIILPDNLTTINRAAFGNCTSLKKFTFSDSVKAIPQEMFTNCSNLTTVHIGSSIEDIYRFGSNSLNIAIDSRIKNTPFYGCNNLTEFTVSEDNAYFSAQNGVLYNKNLTEIQYIPNTVSDEFTIIPSLTTVSDSLFEFILASDINSFAVAEGNTNFVSVDGVLYTADKKELVICPTNKSGSVYIENGTEQIHNWAFYNCDGITSVTLPETIVELGEYCFYDCDGITTINIPDNLIKIPKYAFYNCTFLTDITLPSALTEIGDNSFANCIRLNNMILPETLKAIKSNAFYGCSSIKSFIIPDSVTTYGTYAFEGCTALESFHFGAGMQVMYFLERYFNNCSNLAYISVSEKNPYYYSSDGILYNKTKTEIEIIPQLITGSITIPAEIKTFTYELIDNCKNLTDIYVEEDSKYFCAENGILYSADKKTLIVCPRGKAGTVKIAEGCENISKYSFNSCINITKITMPNTVTYIDLYAFNKCSNIVEYSLSENLETIQSFAFGNNSSLKSIHLPDSVSLIGASAFFNASSLVETNIPKSLTHLAEIFYPAKLTELILPETLQSFKSQYCSSLKKLVINNKYCEYTSSYAPNISKNCVVYAYCGSPGHTLATKRLLNFESLGHTYLDWYVYVPATFESEGIERRDCAYCDDYEERIIAKLQKDVFTATFVADGEVVASVDFPKGTTEITEPAVPAKDRYLGEWEDYTLADENITINAKYTLIKSDDASDIKNESSVVHYTGKDDILFKLKSSAEATVVKSTITNAVPLDIVLVVDQSGSMDETLGGKTKKVDALKDAATAFVNTVYENGKLTGVDHRISIVGFGLSGDYSGFEKNENTELLTSANGVVRFDRIKPSDYASSLLHVSKNGALNSQLTDAIESIAARGATAADLGFEMAKGVFANTDSTIRQRVIVFMTDGEPTYLNGFQTSVANSAIANAYTLKTAYDASVYSVGVFAASQNSTNIKKFMNAVSSGYPDAKSMTNIGKGTDGLFYTTVEHTDSLASVFKSISTESLSHTAPFDNITIIKTLSDCITLTTQQEQTLRIDLIRQYGITNDDIIISRNSNGTTTIQINSLTPKKVTDDEGNVTYEVNVEFFASLNEKAVADGEYFVDTEDSGVMLGEDSKGYESTFDISSIKLDSERTRVIFTINGEVYEISENIENGYAVAPEVEISEDWTFVNWQTSGQKAENGLILDATLIKAERTITWHTDNEDIVQTYFSGDFIVAPEVSEDAYGNAFLSWNRSIPTTMPDENLEFTAIYGAHVHNYNSKVTLNMTCTSDGKRTFTCICGDSYEEVITATGHNYESITPSLEKNDAKCTFVCTYCGDKYDYALDYQVVTASGKRYNVLYEFQLTDDNLNYGFQPDGEIQIRIPLSELHTNAKKVTVIRTNDDGSTTEVPAVIEDGFLIITCDHFTPYEVRFDIPCENHIQSEWIITKESTCTQEGSKYIQCTECETVIIEETIPVAEHIDADSDGFCDIGKEELKTEDAETDTENVCNRCGEIHTNFFAKFFCFIKYLIKRIFGF